MLRTRAPAKVNLTLTVHGRRADGYHELTSLVAFAGVGDELSLDPEAREGLTTAGPFGHGLETQGNLVLKAAAAFRERVPGLRGGAFHLVKRLPVASGIGGGSADAAAALRLLARLNGLRPGDPRLFEAAQAVGADVPVCLASRARVMTGIGDGLGPTLRLPSLFAVLVNPGVATPTPAVFAALGLKPGERFGHAPDGTGAPGSWHEDWPDSPDEFVGSVLAPAGNDLETPAKALVPEISEVLAALSAAPGCRLARMSGSGATCFGLFRDCRASAEAVRLIKARQPAWWVKPTVLR